MSSGILDPILILLVFLQLILSLCLPVCEHSILPKDILVTLLQGISLRKCVSFFKVLVTSENIIPGEWPLLSAIPACPYFYLVAVLPFSVSESWTMTTRCLYYSNNQPHLWGVVCSVKSVPPGCTSSVSSSICVVSMDGWDQALWNFRIKLMLLVLEFQSVFSLKPYPEYVSVLWIQLGNVSLTVIK